MGIKKRERDNIAAGQDSDDALSVNLVADLGHTVSAPLTSDRALPIGSVDVLSHQQILGWVWNPADPEETVIVEIFDGTELIIRIPANILRHDVRSAGIGTGKYGFNVTNLSALLPLARHRISVRRATDGVDLPGSPKWLDRPAAGFDSSAAKFLDSAASASISVARSTEELDSHVSLALRVLNRLLNARQSLDNSLPLVNDPRLQDLLLEAEVSDWTRELVSKIEGAFLPIRFEPVDEPTVSIIIPVFNKFPVTYNCVKSILEHLPKATFEVIIVDDCSRDETLFASFVLSGGVQIIRNVKNQGFVGSCNAGAAAAKGKYLFFLNNDTLMRPEWLDELVKTFQDVPNVGIVGSKLLFENGVLQEAGGIIWRLADGWNWGRGMDANNPRFCYLRDVDYVSGAALMIERTVFEQLGGFDEYYKPAYYEDTDLCFRVRSTGRRVVMQPASEIVHLEGVSAGTDVRGSGMKRYQLINHRKFYERWRDTLSTHRFSGEQPELEAERSVKRRALFIDDTVPTPDQDAGSNAALQHMLALIRLGYKVTFLPADNMAQINPYTANLQKLGIECLYAPHYWAVEEVFRKTAIKPDLVYLHRYSNASKYANMVKQHFPKCFSVYNVADLHSLRQKRELEVEGSLASGPVISEELEMIAMRSVDAVIVHSSVEAKILQAKDPNLRVHNVPWTVLPRPVKKSFKERSGYGFVGGYAHRPNVDAALYIAREIAPLLNKSHPGLPGFLIGSKPPSEVINLNSGSLNVVGFVPELTGVLHQLRCTVAPLRYGAGLKGKILESFAHGLPCIMSEVASEGFDLPRELEWLVAHSATDYADKIAAAHEDEALNTKLSGHVLDFVRKRYSALAIEQSLAASIAKEGFRSG